MDARAQTIVIRGKVGTRDAAAPLLLSSGDTVLVERGHPRLLIMRCPCNCGDDLIINLDKRSGAAWRYYITDNGLTLYPSYWRDTACGSHFIIWNNEIYWCSDFGIAKSERWMVSSYIEKSVLAILPVGRFIKYTDIADQLNLIPWEALQACHQLVKQGKAIAGKYNQSTEFSKVQYIKKNKGSWFKSLFGQN